MKNLLYISLIFFFNLPAQPNPLLKAMKEELHRSMKRLVIKEEKRPYFISYLLIDRKSFSTSARLGALTSSDDDRFRFLNVCVRIGDYKFDNIPSSDELYPFDPKEMEDNKEYMKVPIPLQDDPKALRHALWLLTDLRYKKALRQYSKKEGKRAREVEEERSDDFSKEEPVRYIGEEVELEIDKEKWEKKVKDYSALFKNYPDILEASVSFNAEAKNDYLVSSEGTEIQKGKVYYWLGINASTQASDGMWVRSFRTFFGWKEEELPEDEEVKREIGRLIEEVLALKDAPVMEAYMGPAIIQSPASGVFIHEVLGHRLEAHRLESTEYGETFKGKVGKKIMPEFIMVYDDPTVREYEGMPLDGYYLFDEEGVKAQKVVLVDKGILKSFLLSRKPIKGFYNSNGHGRAQMVSAGWGDVPVARQGNLILESSETKTFSELKDLLIEECEKRDKPYGLIFVRSEGGGTITGRGWMESFQEIPLLVYRVDAETGEEELVRGIKFGGTPLISLDKIIAVGDDPKVFNGFCGAESGAVPVGLVAPSILVSEIEIAKGPTGKEKPPILPPPFISVGQTFRSANIVSGGGTEE